MMSARPAGKNCLVFVSCYNLGVSPSILNLLDFLSENHATTLLLFNVAGRLGRRFADRPLQVLVLEELLGTPDGIARVRALADQDTVHIAFDPHGFALALLLFPRSRPFYYSLELYMSYDHFGLEYPDEIRSAERSQINCMSGLIIQSAEKERLFREDYGLDPAIPSFLLPVTGNGPVCPEKSDWLRQRYAISPNRKIALALGGIREWYASIEMAQTFACFDDWVLLLHGFSSPDYLSRLHDVLQQQGIGNVIVSTDLVDDPEAITSLVQSCDIGIAWYENISVGFRCAGRSSGKIASYLRHGLPVISTRYPSTVESIEVTGCGVCITDLAEMRGALDHIIGDYSRYTSAALREYTDTYHFESYREPLTTFLSLSGDRPAQYHPSSDKRRVLLVVSHFWPSIGGLETIAEQLACGLVKADCQVTVLTFAMSARQADSYQGVRIISVDPLGEPMDILAFSHAMEREIMSGAYTACIVIQDPLGALIWTLEDMKIPPGTRLIIQPIINAEGYSAWRDNQDFCRRLAAILNRSDAAVTLTQSGIDDIFMRSHGIRPVYLPNAVEVPAVEFDFRQRYGIPQDAFLLLHVANLYWVKNHAGLLRTLGDLPTGWSLVMVGHPTGEPECALNFLQLLQQYPQVRHIPGLARYEVSAAMGASDMVLLSSNGEGSPVTILEAMAHSKPWLATPACGAAADNAGGLLCELDQFPVILQKLQRHPELRSYLGRLGYDHWKACYSWEKVLHCWVDLIKGSPGRTEFVMPAHVKLGMKLVQKLLE